MESTATTTAQNLDASTPDERDDGHSLLRIILLLSWVRYMSVLSGVGFIILEAIVVFWLGRGFAPAVLAEVFMFILFGPVLVWFTSTWGEKMARRVAQSQDDLKGTAAELALSNENLASEIAERTRFEQELREYTGELARSNADLEQFAYVASHDLQEPLRMVSSYTQLLARRYQGQLDGDADEFISYAVDGVNRMQQLINDLLTYSRIGRGEDRAEPTDFNQALRKALANLKTAIEDSGASVTSDELPTIKTDPALMTQLFQNLIGNAVKFRRDEPLHVQVSAELRGQEWLFSVQDNGMGVEPEYAERIFVIFQRLHTRDEFSGTGIGLAICKKIVERQAGRIWVESRPGEGSSFYFTVPISNRRGDG